MRRGHICVLLRHASIALHDPTAHLGAAFGVDEGFQGRPDRFGLGLESTRRHEGLELAGERLWYTNRKLYRHADSIPPNPGTVGP